MKPLLSLFASLSLLYSATAFAAAELGKAAPDFSVAGAAGDIHHLSDYLGKTVVLEWYNKDCPFVRKHYDTQNMQDLQKELVAKDVVWLTVVSSAPGKQGHQNADAVLANAEKEGSAADAILRDESGTMGRAYGAKTTPHMYVIDEKGVLRYNGAIDNIPSANPASVRTAQNYVRPAVNNVLAGEEVVVKSSQPYGCSVKY